MTDAGLAALRSQMPYADLKDLERDRRLNRIDDLFTVDLLSRFITWKLGGSGEADSDAQRGSSSLGPEQPALRHPRARDGGHPQWDGNSQDTGLRLGFLIFSNDGQAPI